MTLEELKEEAKRQGYYLLKAVPYTTLLPCVCGGKIRRKYYLVDEGGKVAVKFECKRCGFEGPSGSTEQDAKELWNKAVKEKLNGSKQG